MLLVILLNFFSFFYTKNYYYTNVAVTMNLTALLFMYFVALHLTGKSAFWLLVLTALSGVLVSIETWFEFYDKSTLFQWMTPGSMVIGTIGNSNYLGAYLLFPSSLSSPDLSPQGKTPMGCRCSLDLRVCSALVFKSQGGMGRRGAAVPGFIFSVIKIHGFSLKAYLRSRARHAVIYGVSALCSSVSLGTRPSALPHHDGLQQCDNPTTFILRTQKYFQAPGGFSRRVPLRNRPLVLRNLVYDAQAELERVEEISSRVCGTKPRRFTTSTWRLLTTEACWPRWSSSSFSWRS